MALALLDDTLIERYIEGDMIVLDNVPIRIERGIGYSLTSVHGRKQQQGEPGPDDHQYNSTHTQRTWVGGYLVRDLQETSDIGKSWTGHAWVHTRGALGHALKTVQLKLPTDNPGGVVTPLDRLGNNFYYAVGTLDGRIYEYRDDGLDRLIDVGEEEPAEYLGTVMNRGRVFRAPGEDDLPETWLYIPTTAGYTRMRDDFTVVHAVDAEDPNAALATLGFAVHENKLYRLTTDSRVWFTIGNEDEWQHVGTIPDGSEPRNIWRDYDDDSNRVIMLSTSSGAWMLDHDNAMVWETDLTFPDHAYQGLGAAAWRADTYVSVGVGVHRKVGQLVTAAGLDDDDGLPAPFVDGLIVDLAESYNWLVAAIAGEPRGQATNLLPDREAFNVSQGQPYPITNRGTQARVLGNNRMGSIYVQNGLGWSEMYTWNRPPTRVVVSMVRNPDLEERHQHMFFGDVDGGAFAIKIPMGYYNPIESPNLPLDRNSTLTESRIDWNAPDIPKVAKQLNIRPHHLWHKPDPLPNTPIYKNRIEVICNWVDLDGIEHTSDDPDEKNGPGPYAFSDGTEVLRYLTLDAHDEKQNTRKSASIGWERYKNTDVLLATGLPHEAIWFTYRFVGDDRSDFTGGVIQWRTIIARRMMRPNRIWTFQVRLDGAVHDKSETDVARMLDRICLKPGGVPMVTGETFAIVDVTQLEGSLEAGLSPRGMRTITCLEFTDITYEDVISAPVND